MEDMDIARNLKMVLQRVFNASKNRTEDLKNICTSPRLIAVTKTKPRELIVAAYKEGQIHFGENYVQELVEKSHDEKILLECPNIKWNMIGHLQSNKVSKILNIPNLDTIETIDSPKLASIIDKGWKKLKKPHPLKIFAQINTSLEANKFGVLPKEASDLVGHILSKCPNLDLVGLMTIGAFDYDMSLGPNPDFQVLIKCREDVCQIHNLEISRLELSMGMSADFEHAIEVGSTNVRVGSTIFGARVIKTKE